MFYSQFILAKKGPLGTIWIAAHLERKLRKNQVADTDIGLSVDSILSPEVPIALRLSSHLLLGVVRIYSRKVNYLFHDCSEAVLKVKQAFRSTAVDLPPEESTAPYHSITLPETFHLDDFELPDSAFQGDFIDHHVSTKEQITLQDTMDGAGFLSMQFGLDERFGDGNASQIRLDLDEDIFLDKHLSSQHVSLSPSHPECYGHQHQSSSVFATEMEIDNQNEFIKDENADFLNDKPVLFNDHDSQNVEHKKNDDLSNQCQGYSVQTPDLNEVFSTNDDLEEPPPDLIECSHAPSTPGLVEEIFTAGAHESPALSPQQKLSPSIGEATVRLECPDVMTDNDLVHGIAMDPDSVNPMQVGSSPTSVSLEQAEQTTVPDETQAEFGQDTASAQNNFLPSEAKELLIDDQGSDPGQAILCNESQAEDIRLPTSPDASDPKVPFDGSALDNGVINTASKILSDSVMVSEEALVDKHDAQPSCSSLEHIDVNPVPSASSFHLRSCTSQANLANPAAEDGAAVQNALQIPPEEQGVQLSESARELFQDNDLSSGKDCLIGNAADVSLQAYDNIGDSVTEATLHVASTNELLAGHLQKCTQLEQLNCSSTSDFLEPEKMLLAPLYEQDQANDLSQLVLEKGVTESDGSVNRVSSLSGRKRPLDESASFQQNDSSAKLSRTRLKSNIDHIPDDDDLLASILVGKRTPLLRLGSTPQPAKEASLKRPRTQSKLGTAKRKVLLDDTTILHADAIRLQLINTEDIRRVRKKAPCTRPEIWMIQKNCLEDEIFDEPILTGISEKLTSLQTMLYDSEVGQHILHAKPSKEYDLSQRLELEVTENEKIRADLFVQENRDGATEELCGPSGSNEARIDKDTDIHHEELCPLSIPHQLDSSDNTGSLINSTKDLSEHGKGGLPVPCGSDSPCMLECEAGAHHITDEISLHNSNISTSLLEKSDELDIQKVQASVDALAQTSDMPFTANDDLSLSSKNACTEGLAAVVNPECGMADQEAQFITDDVNMNHVEGSNDAANSCVMAECKRTNSVLDSSVHEVEAANATSSSTDVCHTSSPLQSMLLQNNQLAELTVTADHQVMGDGESVLVAHLNDETVKLLNDEESTVIFVERPEQIYVSASQPNGGYGNAPSVVGETSDLQAVHLEGEVVVESTGMDLTTAKDTSDFWSEVDGNDTEFLNVDDEEDCEEAAGNDMQDTQDAHSLENSGWSSRTRGVARYLKTLFDEESGLGRKSVVMDQLIAGKTRKEASRMFFETLVLKTKDYIHVEQPNPCDFIAIKPRAKLLKSEF